MDSLTARAWNLRADQLSCHRRTGGGAGEPEIKIKEKKHFIAKRKGIFHPDSLSLEERNALIRENPAYGTIICRCERITEGEILDAIHRPLGARSVDGVKRRTRAGMGRCQGGFVDRKSWRSSAGSWEKICSRSQSGRSILYGERLLQRCI